MKFCIYEGRDGWCWRLVARNGHIMADSAESYTRKADVIRAIERVRDGFDAPIRDNA